MTAKPRLRARQTPTGTWAVHVKTPHRYSRAGAARILAELHPNVRRFGHGAIVRALNEAARHGITGDQADPATAAHYETQLADDGWPITVRLEHAYTLTEAAVALTTMHPTPPRRFGHTTSQRALNDAAQQGITGRDTTRADPRTIAFYRRALVDLAVFPATADQPNR